MKSPISPQPLTEVVPITLITMSVVASIYFYSHFPESVATHWNIRGQADGFSSKAFAAFFFPMFSMALYALFLSIPYLDPKKDRYQQFTKVYHVFKNLIIGFLTLIYLVVGLNGIGYAISVSTVVPLAVGFLILILGNYMSKIQPNWFMGIRTPWTLSSDEVWKKTHQLGGKLFMVFGCLMILGAFLPAEGFWFTFIPGVILASVVPMVYSFILYKRLNK